MKKLIVLALAVSVLSACNTFAGLGQDVKKVGEALEKKASE